jgi:NADH-quinone oxidoreductase subunit J
MQNLIYFALATVAILSACCVVLSRHTIYCALSLVVTMLALAGIFLLIQSPFVAVIQVLVYAGAVMVLFLYVIMLINPRHTEPIIGNPLARRWARILFFTFLMLVCGWLGLLYSAEDVRGPWELVSVKTIATRLLTDFLLPFELTSVLLLVAILGAVLIARRD